MAILRCSEQYGGSEAHSTVFKQQRGDWEYVTAVMDKLTSLRRFYNNTYTDSEKQDAVNLFLGNYIPIPGQPAIWQLDSDSYLHSGMFRLQTQSWDVGSSLHLKCSLQRPTLALLYFTGMSVAC